MTTGGEAIDTGTGYGLQPATYKANLVEVGPGTPMGELLRRYWQPCFVSDDLTSDKPRKVRLLGEDLILFRDKQGRPGLVHEHCCHRGTSLYYGRVEDDGIRCCYHGWKFDAQGRCLEQPAEVDGGRNRSKIRQPWYPVEERYGLVYAYMGPPEKKPVLPRWEHFENLGADEVIDISWDMPYAEEGKYVPFNWLQQFENCMDTAHVPWLHYYHSGDQFGGTYGKVSTAEDQVPPYARIKNLAEQIVAERSELGVTQGAPIRSPAGELLMSRIEAVLPNIGIVPNFVELSYVVPIDDTHFLNINMWRAKFKGEKSAQVQLINGKSWEEMTEEEHQLYPGDFEAQGSIGRLPAHSREHLSTTDVAVVMLRRRLEEAVRAVQEGRDPPNVSFDPDAPPLKTSGHPLLPVTSAA